MRRALLPLTVVFSLAAFGAWAADPASEPDASATAGDTTDATHPTFTEGAPAQDRTPHTKVLSWREPDLDRKPDDGGEQRNITGVVADRLPDREVICRYAPMTGSRIGTELCMPLYRWKQMHDDAQQAIRDHELTSHTGKQDLGFGTF